MFFFWDNLGWGEVGCYGGGVLRGAPTPRIDSLAADGLRLLNFNVEAQCTPSRSALLTGRHPLRSGTATVPVTGGADGLTRWEVTIAQALSEAGYATGIWGKWHLGSDPENRSPVDFGFDEAVWSPRTADEVFWTMQSYFPEGTVTSAPYAGDTQIPLRPQTIYSRKKGGKPEPVSDYDAGFRAGFDRKITEWACDFMARARDEGKPFYVYLPYTQVHIPPIPDPEFVAKTKRGNWADVLTQMDAFTGVILDKLEELGVSDDTIVVWASDNGADSTYRFPAIDPDPAGGQWNGFSGPWRGGYFTSLEGSNRAPCIIRWPGKVPAGKVSNELVHQVDMFPTPAYKHRVTQAEGTAGSAPLRPENLGFIIGWLMFLGVYQIFLAWKFGTFFEGSKGDLRHYFGGTALEPLSAALGVAAQIVAWGGWRLRAVPGLGGAAGAPCSAAASHDFDAAVLDRDADGKIRVVRKHEQPTRHGAAKGLGWGLAIGAACALFPAIGIVGGLAAGGGAGAVIGAVTGHVKGGLDNADLKQLGEVLNKGQAGLIAVYAVNMADQIAASIKAQNKYVSKEIDANADELAKQIKAAEGS